MSNYLSLSVSVSLSFSPRKSLEIQKERSLGDEVKCPLNLTVAGI